MKPSGLGPDGRTARCGFLTRKGGEADADYGLAAIARQIAESTPTGSLPYPRNDGGNCAELERPASTAKEAARGGGGQADRPLNEGGFMAAMARSRLVGVRRALPQLWIALASYQPSLMMLATDGTSVASRRNSM